MQPPKLPTPKPGVMDIAPYVPGKSSLDYEGKLIKLSSNENALGCSEKAKAAYIQQVGDLHRYPDGQALTLKTAIHQQLGFKPERVVVGAGSDEVIQFLVNTYVSSGDEVLQSQHGFLMYQIYAKAAGAKPIFAQEKDLHTHVNAMLEAVTRRTKLVFVANPNNPTGTYIPLAELKRLRDGLPAHVLLVVDEAYVEYANAPDYESAAALVETTPNTVILRTFSKAYGLPALRIGFGYMPEAIADALNRVRGPFNLTSAAIAVGAAAVADQEFIQQSIKHNTTWRTWLTDEVTALGFEVVPSQGNFILMRCGIGEAPHAPEVISRLASRGIIIRSTANYGLEDYVRITIGTQEECRAVVMALGGTSTTFKGLHVS